MFQRKQVLHKITQYVKQICCLGSVAKKHGCDTILTVYRKMCALAAAAQIEHMEAKVQAMSGLAPSLALIGDREGLRQVLEAAEKVGDKGYRAAMLMGVASALAQAGDPKATEAFRCAVQTARFVGRRAVFLVIENCALLLADLDHGKILRQVMEKVIEVDHWWSN